MGRAQALMNRYADTVALYQALADRPRDVQKSR